MRPKRFRQIFQEPEIRCFKQDSVENSDKIKPIGVTLEEFEAMRLKDYETIQQQKVAEIMNISQPTFHRTLNSARGKIFRALVEGKM